MSHSRGNPFCVCGHRRTDHLVDYDTRTITRCLLNDGGACICKGFVEDTSDERTWHIAANQIRSVGLEEDPNDESFPIQATGKIKTPAFPFPSTAREVDTYLKLKDPQGALFK